MTGRELIAAKYGERTLWAIEDFLDHAAMAERLMMNSSIVLEGEVYLLAAEAILSRLGESVNRMNDRFVDDYPELDLRGIKDNRNLVAHDYHVITHDEILDSFEHELPETVARLEKLLR